MMESKDELSVAIEELITLTAQRSDLVSKNANGAFAQEIESLDRDINRIRLSKLSSGEYVYEAINGVLRRNGIQGEIAVNPT